MSLLVNIAKQQTICKFLQKATIPDSYVKIKPNIITNNVDSATLKGAIHCLFVSGSIYYQSDPNTQQM